MKTIKNLFVLLGLMLIAGFGYYLYSTNGSLGLAGNNTDFNLEAESSELIRRIDSIKRIQIDQDIFSDPRFTTLQSFATPLPVYSVGRNNPFDPQR